MSPEHPPATAWLVALCTLAFAAQITSSSEACAAPPPRAGLQAMSLEHEIRKDASSRFLLYLPASYGTEPGRHWPLLLYLHGGGGRGANLEKLEAYPLVRRLEQEESFPFVVVTPQCPEGELWDTQVDSIDALLNHLLATYAIDPDRVYVMGHSMGGYGAWYLAYRFPRRFAAVVAMSAPGISWWSVQLVGIPVWVLHGADDDAVPVESSRAMVRALEELGGNVRLTVFPDLGHLLFAPFLEDEVFDWLLQQKRGSGAEH